MVETGRFHALQISRHAIQTMLGDALRRGESAHGVLTGGELALDRAVPMAEGEVATDSGMPARAVYVASSGGESAQALRARACGDEAALTRLPLVVIRLGEAGRLEAAMLDVEGREVALMLREDGAGVRETMPHAE